MRKKKDRPPSRKYSKPGQETNHKIFHYLLAKPGHCAPLRELTMRFGYRRDFLFCLNCMTNYGVIEQYGLGLRGNVKMIGFTHNAMQRGSNLSYQDNLSRTVMEDIYKEAEEERKVNTITNNSAANPVIPVESTPTAEEEVF